MIDRLHNIEEDNRLWIAMLVLAIVAMTAMSYPAVKQQAVAVATLHVTSLAHPSHGPHLH
jgi:hypothetical protein